MIAPPPALSLVLRVPVPAFPQARRPSLRPLRDSAAASGQAGGSRELPQFPPGQYPVKLPSVSFLGARNDLPNPYAPGVSWGQLPEGRKWGSTASVTTAPDGKLWVVDRCGASGAGGATTS